MLPIQVLYEDDQLLVVNKPAGLVVNRAETVAEETLQDWVVKYLGILPTAKGGIWEHRGGLAHRLDKDTSGCLIVAKSEPALKELMRQFKQREVSKTYQALVHGRVEPKGGYWRLPVKRSITNRQSFTVDITGKMAVTDYQVDEYLRVPDLYGGEEGYPEGLTMVWLYPKTGRTHQLRVHLRHMHHSIVADRVYLSKKRLKYDLVWCKRHFLHAQSITFVIPKREKKITVQAPLPNDLTQAIVRVRTDG